MSALFTMDCDSGIYSKNLGHLQYVPTSRENISPERCYNTAKCDSLIKEIEEKNIPDAIKKMLKLAATRHIVFNYQMLAEFYAQADKEVQELMEKSGLVIIDFEDALRNGFVKLTETLKELKDESENISK